MMTHKVSSIAIVDEEGKLVETLTTTDFLLVSKTTLDTLGKPVFNFLKDSAQGERPKPVEVDAHSDIKGVLQTMLDHQVHRVWIVNNKTERKPIGCVSMSDVLASLLPNKTAESKNLVQEE